MEAAKGYARASLQVVGNTNRVMAELDPAKGNSFADMSWTKKSALLA